MQLSGKVALVTGASRGIGKAILTQLIAQGATVIGTATSEAGAQQISATIAEHKGTGQGLVLDMGSTESIEALLATIALSHPCIDILVNNAGIGYDALTEKIDVDTYHYVFDLDLIGPLAAMQQVIPLMRKQGEGTIINVSSAVALMTLPNNAPYASIKRALATLTQPLERN